MKKAKFNYYGHLSLGGQIALLLICCLVLVFEIMFWNSVGMQENFPLLFIFLSLVSIACWIAHNIVINGKQLAFEDGQLMITHLFTKKVQKIQLKELAGYQLNELTLKTQLIDLQGKAVAILYHPFYKDLNTFFLEKGIKRVGMDERYFRRLAI